MNWIKAMIVICILGTSMMYADEAKAVYDVTSGDSAKIEKHMIKSIKNVYKHYKGQNKEVKTIVVISGDAYKYFIRDLSDSPYAKDKSATEIQPKFISALKELNDRYNVTFKMCSAGMKARGIKQETIYKFVHADAIKNVYLIDAQNDGYAYIPVH
ncbi:DsrE family protein [Sulfurimonas sp.]|uniref:DsrE family protein n=1 Tax=Sulfurimonas sp. TaxID=2022749 RepID=UPI003562B9FE